MDRYEFLSSVLPATGIYCAAVIRGGVVKHKFTDSIEQLADLCGRGCADGADAYMALAGFSIKERKQQAVSALKALWLDIDCGAAKADAGQGYREQWEAVEAIKSFCSGLGLQRPTINSSGRGLHAYWPLTASIAPEEWLPLAKALKAACKARGLLADPAVTSDTARILRAPQTLNFKDPARPLRVVVTHEGSPSTVGEIRSALEEFMPRDKAPAGIPGLEGAQRFVMDEATKAIADSRISVFKDIVVRSLSGKGCAQVAYIIGNQASVDEPLWRAGLSIAWHCEDRDTAIHKMSSKHPDYTPAATLAKAQATKGPYRCEWFQENHGDRCKKCKHKLSSPIQLSTKFRGVETAREEGEPPVVEPRRTTTDVAEHETPAHAPLSDPGFDVVGAMESGIATLAPGYAPVRETDLLQYDDGGDDGEEGKRPMYAPPFPYYRGAHGGVFRRAPDGEAEDKRVYEHDLFPTKLIEDPVAGFSVEMNHFTVRHGLRKFVAPFTDLTTPDKCRVVLSRNGVIAPSHAMTEIMNYQIAYVQDIFKNKTADTARMQFGWADGDTKFVIGTREVQARKVTYSPPSTATSEAVGFYDAQGDLKTWKRAFNLFVGQENSKQAFALMTAFGAPLIKYTGSNGALISLVSNQSGTGKTTVLQLVNSVWGHPTGSLLQKDDTFMSKIHRIGVLNNLPMTVDEITNLDLADVSELVYSLTTGRGRNRMEAASNRERRNTTRWSTIGLATGNSFLSDKLAAFKSTSDGEQMRLIEIEIAQLAENPRAEELIASVQTNYGLAGEIYAQYLITHRDQITKHVEKLRKKFIEDVKAVRKERFWINAVVSNMVGGIIAQRLGLHDYDMRSIYRWAVMHFGEMREIVGGQSVDMQDVLGDFINSNLNHYLVFDSRSKNALTGTYVVRQAVGKVLVRYERDKDCLFVSKTDFRKYCVDRQIGVQAALSSYTGDFTYVGEVKKRMAAGSGVNSPATDAYRFDCKIELEA